MIRIGSVTISAEIADELAPRQAVCVRENGELGTAYFALAASALDGNSVRFRRDDDGPQAGAFTGRCYV